MFSYAYQKLATIVDGTKKNDTNSISINNAKRFDKFADIK